MWKLRGGATGDNTRGTRAFNTLISQWRPPELVVGALLKDMVDRHRIDRKLVVVTHMRRNNPSEGWFGKDSNQEAAVYWWHDIPADAKIRGSLLRSRRRILLPWFK